MKKTTNKQLLDLVLAALFLALGLLLPFLTGQIPQIGSMLLPMHIPVLICGLVCSWKYGMAVGALLPLLRNLLFGMPPLFPTGISMTFELAAYGLIAGIVYGCFKRQNVRALYISLISAMLGGRMVWGVAQIVLLGMSESGFTWSMFMAGAFLNAIPGIVLQLILIPVLMVALDRTGMVKFNKDIASI